MNSTFSRLCIHRAESPIVAASGCPSTSFSPAPSAAVSRFRASKILRLGLIVGPVVFQVPERPNRTPNLFIVVSGELSFERPNPKSAPLRTKDFATRVAYFRSKPGRLEHVYGAHYDMDEQVRRHPVFHAQFRPYEQFAQCIQTLFHRDDEIDGYLCNVLRNVRIPTAQMDVFSVLTQICADHLIDEQSTSEVTDAFQRMRIACNFFEGAARRVAFLGTASCAKTQPF